MSSWIERESLYLTNCHMRYHPNWVNRLALKGVIGVLVLTRNWLVIASMLLMCRILYVELRLIVHQVEVH